METLNDKLKAIDADESLSISEKNAAKAQLLRSLATSVEQRVDVLVIMSDAEYLCQHKLALEHLANTHPHCEIVLLGKMTDEQKMQIASLDVSAVSSCFSERHNNISIQYALDKLDASRHDKAFIVRVGNMKFERLLGIQAYKWLMSAVPAERQLYVQTADMKTGFGRMS